MTGWDFAGQNLTKANLSSATLTNASLTNANLTNASFFRHVDQRQLHEGRRGWDRIWLV